MLILPKMDARQVLQINIFKTETKITKMAGTMLQSPTLPLNPSPIFFIW